MLIWQGVIGKMVGFMSTKLAGKWVDLKLDEKKRAARTFVKLYFAMEQLEEITTNIVKVLGEAEKGTQIDIHGGSLLYLSKEVDANTVMFLDSVADLGKVIELYDPVLAAELVQLSTYKASFLIHASETFRVESDPVDDDISITYAKPAVKFLVIDFDKIYEWLRRRDHLYDVTDVFEWPENFVVRYCIEEGDLETRVVRINDIPGIIKFRGMLEEHSTALSEGRERLRSLIGNHFKPEDILYVSKALK
jgi:hypothetical protein